MKELNTHEVDVVNGGVFINPWTVMIAVRAVAVAVPAIQAAAVGAVGAAAGALGYELAQN